MYSRPIIPPIDYENVNKYFTLQHRRPPSPPKDYEYNEIEKKRKERYPVVTFGETNTAMVGLNLYLFY
jgi:hypothetical protein